MKSVFVAVALSAIVAVRASEGENSAPLPSDQLRSLLGSEGAGGLDWARFSPDALGMQLNYDEMSSEELRKVVEAFKKLGLISEEEVDSFTAALVDPRMRAMLQKVTENWPETMSRVLRDKNYIEFLKNFDENMDEEALSTIVGIKGGIQGAVEAANEEQ